MTVVGRKEDLFAVHGVKLVQHSKACPPVPHANGAVSVAREDKTITNCEAADPVVMA